MVDDGDRREEVKRTILRLKTRAFDLSAKAENGTVVVKSDLGVHRFQALGSDVEVLRAYAQTKESLELVVLVDRDAVGSILGGELLEVIGPIVNDTDGAACSGVRLRSGLVDDGVDDVDTAFDRIRHG